MARPARKVRIVIGLPPWSRTVFEVYMHHQRVTDAEIARYAAGARENGWRHVQVAVIQPRLVTTSAKEKDDG